MISFYQVQGSSPKNFKTLRAAKSYALKNGANYVYAFNSSSICLYSYGFYNNSWRRY